MMSVKSKIHHLKIYLALTQFHVRVCVCIDEIKMRYVVYNKFVL